MKHTLLILCTFALAFLHNPSALHAQAEGSESQMKAWLSSQGIAVSDNNRVRLLPSGQEKFDDLFDAIRGARHHIHLEYFNFRNDSIGNALFDLLAEKAAEGVEVRAMFDAFGNWSNNRPLRNKHLKSIRSRGIEVVKFDPIKFPWVNHVLHRDHRKIVVIDGHTGYTGGMNVADYYLHGLPGLGQWHDMHIRIEGDAVRYLQGIFLTMWNQETGQHVGGPEYFADLPVPEQESEEVAIIDRVPRETPRIIRQTYATAIDSAKHVIRIINPYFVPTKSIRRALKDALKRGVRVELLIPSVSDVPFTPDAALYFAHKLMKRGAYVYLFNGGFHHSKVMTVDDEYCTVGTANLNSRSLRYDYETNAFIFDPRTTRRLNAIFRRDCLNSTRLTKEWWMQRPKRRKIVGWFAHLFTPVL